MSFVTDRLRETADEICLDHDFGWLVKYGGPWEITEGLDQVAFKKTLTFEGDEEGDPDVQGIFELTFKLEGKFHAPDGETYEVGLE